MTAPKDIMFAIQQGNTQQAITLIESDDSIDQNELNTYLGLSVLYCQLDLANFLLKQGADINYENGIALYHAIRLDYLPMIKLLIEENITANINQSFHFSCSLANFKIIDYFISKGFSLTENEDQAFLSFLAHSQYKQPHPSFHTHLADMLKRGANIHADQNFLLNIAIKQHDLSLVKTLVEKGVNVNGANSSYPENKLSPLACACNEKQVDIAEYLLTQTYQQINIDEQDGLAILTSVKNKHPQLVRLLCQYGANVTLNNHQVFLQSLKISHSQEQEDIVNCLLKYGADINANNSECLMTFLTYSTVDLDMMNTFVYYGATLPDTFYSTNNISQHVKDIILELIQKRDFSQHLETSLSTSQHVVQPKI